MQESKPVLTSKINWIGLFTISLSFLGWLAGQEIIANNPKFVAAVGVAIGVLTVLVRTYGTSLPVNMSFRTKYFN